MNQWWPRYASTYGVNKQQWVKYGLNGDIESANGLINSDHPAIIMKCDMFNSYPPNAAYMRQWIVSAVLQIGSALSPVWCQAIIWTNAGSLSIGPLGTMFSEILMKIQFFSFIKMHLKISSAKWQPFCQGGDGLTTLSHKYYGNQCWLNIS